MKHLSNWLEIPVTDMERARAFYARVLQEELPPAMELAGNQYSLFPSEDRFNCGALAKGDGYVPARDGVTVYLDGGDDLDGFLDRVTRSGGTVVLPRTYLGKEAGHIGLFLDSEGNRMGLQGA